MHDNAPVRSQKYIQNGAEIFRAREGAVLWQAHSSASRNSKAVPLPLFSVSLAVLRAATFQDDDDNVAHLMDDLARVCWQAYWISVRFGLCRRHKWKSTQDIRQINGRCRCQIVTG